MLRIRHYMAWALLSTLVMTVTNIVKLADGEEMISYESSERVRPSLDDPRRGALERRGAAEAARQRALESRLPANRRG
jgi:hypothetical protein